MSEKLYEIVDCEDWDIRYGILHCDSSVSGVELQSKIREIKSSNDCPEDWDVEYIVENLPKEWNAWLENFDGTVEI